MLKPLLLVALTVAMWGLYLMGQSSGTEFAMAYARDEAAHYQQALEAKDNELSDAQVQAVYWKRSFEKLLSGPGTAVFDCFAVSD